MKFLKVVNRPLDHAIPKKLDGSVNWASCGVNVERMSTLLCQGFDTITKESYVSLMPIDDETNAILLAVIEATNNNENPLDTAEIIEQADYDALKTEILSVRALTKAQG